MNSIKNRKMFSIISIILIIIPLFIMLSNVIIADDDIVDNIWYYGILYLGIFSIICLFIYIFKIVINKKIKYNIKDFIPLILLLFFMVWTFITTICSNNLLISLGGSAYRHEGFITYIAYAGFLLSAILINDKDKTKFYKLFVIVGVLLSLVTINKNFITNLIVGESYEYKSIFHQFNHFGYFLLMALICNVNLFINANTKFKKIFYFFSFALMMQMLIINNTFGSYLAVLGGIIILGIYYLFINKKRKSYLIILIAFLILSINIKDPMNSRIILEFKENLSAVFNIDYKNINNKEEQQKLNALGTNRGILWKSTITLIKKKPILGYGLDNIGFEMERMNAGNDRPHNMILQMAVYTGIPGMILYISSICIIIYQLIMKIKKLPIEIIISLSVIISYLISSLTANSMFYTSPYFLIFLGFSIGELYKNYLNDIDN